MDAEASTDATLARRSLMKITTLEAQGQETDLSSTTVEDRWKMMWPLALQAWAFMGTNVEPRLQRHVERVIRG